MGTTLFVYGTLKSGQPANDLLAGQEFIGPARTIPLYRLVSLGRHPGLVLDRQNGRAIEGELWRVDDRTLARLDEYEGTPDYFSRQPIAIADHFAEVHAYFFAGVVPPDAASGDRWPLSV